MLGGQHALFESCWRVDGLNWHFGLSQHLAGVELIGDDVNRTAADLIACADRAGMGVEASVLWKQGRVDVDDPPRPAVDEPGREDAHEARKRKRSNAMFIESRSHTAGIILPLDNPADHDTRR